MSYELRPAKRALLFISLSLATFMMVLDYSIANVSIPYIAGNLAVSSDQGTYVITSFAVGNSIGLAMTGWLTKRVGNIHLMVWAIGLFTFFSWLCGFSFSLEMLVVSRFIQGFVAGPVIPLSQSLLIMQGTEKTRTRDISIWSTIIITAPVVGPILGGYISDWYHWSWIFYINIPVGIFCMVAIWWVLKGFETEKEREPGDILGMFLLAVGVSSLQVFLDKGQQWDWFNSSLIVALAVGAVLAFALLIIRELLHKKPLLDVRLFAIPSFVIAIVCLLVSYAIYFGTIILVPLWLQQYMGYTSEWAGIVVAALGVGPVLLTVFVPKVIGFLGNLRTLMIAFVVFACACFYSSFFSTNVDAWIVAGSRFFFGVGFVFYISPLIGMSVEGISEKRLPAATGIFHFSRAMVGAVGTSIFTTMWIRRTIFHHARLAEVVDVSGAQGRALEQVNSLVDAQASMLAINDVFYVMGWCFIVLIALLVFWNIAARHFLRVSLVESLPRA